MGHRYLTPESVPEAVAPPYVKVEQPVTGDIELFRSMTGTIEPADSVYVIPKAAGEITAVYVKNGDYVEEGQLLCEIDTKQVDGARLQLEAAEIALKDATTNLNRMSRWRAGLNPLRFSMIRRSWLMTIRWNSAVSRPLFPGR